MNITKGPATGKAKAYASSAVGILHACALVSSFITFVCNESVPWCKGSFYCTVPAYRTTYTYFSSIALAAVLISGVLYVLHCTGFYNKLRYSSKKKLLMELACVSGIVFFYAFGNLLMISRTGNRILYMVSTFFGFVAMWMFVAQLVLLFRLNYSRLIAEGHKVESAEDVDSDDSTYPEGESGVQVTVIKSWNMGDHSPGNLSQKGDNSSCNSNLDNNNSLAVLSINSISSSRGDNPSMVDNEDYSTSSSSEDSDAELKNKSALSD